MTNKPQADEKLLRVPYFQDKYLIVAASLNGGNVLELLVKVNFKKKYFKTFIFLENNSILQ